MKKLKMLLAIVFAVAVVLGCTPAFAAEAPIQVKSDVPLSKAWSNTEVALSNEVMAAAEYAYMDIDSATPVMQEKILDARNTIIFSQSWTNLAECDGVTVKAIDIKTNTTYDLPDFYDIFPADWEVPSADDDDKQNAADEIAVPNSVATFYLLRRFPNLILSAPPSTANTPNFL